MIRMSNKPPPVNKTFGKSRSNSVNSQPNSTSLSLSNAPKASEGVYPFAVKSTSSILDCWANNPNPFAGREENGPNIARTAVTSTSHEVRPIIATITEPRSRSTSVSSSTNQFPPSLSSSSSASSFVPTMTADQTEREQTQTKKRSMKTEANPPQKSRYFD